MPNGGIIHVKVAIKEKNKVSLYFIDQGAGIPEDRLPTLGEPFFTPQKKRGLA
ncbi:hypothetical protein GCM10020331_081740 [Ectobacillus funiculus]